MEALVVMDAPRPTSELAADVRDVTEQGERAMVELVWTVRNVNWRASLDALVARIADLEAHEDDAMRERDNYESMWRMQRDRAVAAEAQAEKRAANERHLTNLLDWRVREKEAAEAQVAALTQDNAVLRELPSREIVLRAEAAEAALATTRQALERIAALEGQNTQADYSDAVWFARRALAATEEHA